MGEQRYEGIADGQEHYWEGVITSNSGYFMINALSYDVGLEVSRMNAFAVPLPPSALLLGSGLLRRLIAESAGADESMDYSLIVKNGLNRDRRDVMNRSLRNVVRVLLAVAILVGGMLFGTSQVWAQKQKSTLAQQAQGSWALVSVYIEQDGKKIEPFGSQPRGFLTITPNGRFSYILLRASLPKFAADNRMKGTAEENQVVVQGALAVYGRYTVVNEKEHAVKVHIEGSTFPNWDGQDQKRIWTIKGDELWVSNPTTTVGGGVAYLIFKRAK